MQAIISFFIEHLPELGVKLLQQLYMVGITILITVLIGIPLGILATRFTKLKNILLRLVGILQIIPALALLAFLIPFLGIGVKPAIVALVIFALLPIVSNTVAGINGIPSAYIEAANGLGFTSWQRLYLVELPLALPTIIAGIRTATIITVATATLAAFIGAGGLGDFINQGIALNSSGYLLLGAIPAGLLALFFDYIFGEIEDLLSYNNTQPGSHVKLKIYIGTAILILLFLGLLLASFLHIKSKNTIRIATTTFTEQYILGEILSQLIESKTSLKVKRYFNLGTSDVCFQALRNGQIDLYPAYTDIAFLNVLHQPYIGVPRQIIFQRAKDAYFKQFNLLWLDPFGFNDAQALAVRQDFSKINHLTTISDLVPIGNKLKIAAPPEFIKREDGMPGLIKTYGLHFAAIKEMIPSLMYQAIQNQKVEAIVAFATDGRIPAYHLMILQDDKHLFPFYDCAPLIRVEIIKQHPELENVLKLLAGRIDDQTMRQMNSEVDLKKRTPADVAHEFLLSHIISTK